MNPVTVGETRLLKDDLVQSCYHPGFDEHACHNNYLYDRSFSKVRR
jgi:hypothetical protein